MAGLTHSAFRRLLSDFGGYGALYTEMLSARSILFEDLTSSPFTKKRESEGKVLYQLRLTGDEDIGIVLRKLKTVEPFGIDINLGCPAPEIRRSGGGFALFDDTERLRRVLDQMRSEWDGILTVKCRLGYNKEGWEEHFMHRIFIFNQSGVDGICVHPRFADEKLKREARWDLFPSIKAATPLPLIANGDICDLSALELLRSNSCDALMIGRMAVVKPWIFREFSEGQPHIAFDEVWERHLKYICEDFPPEKAIGRVKEFSSYFARNFFFSHEFFRAIQPAPDIQTIITRAKEFFRSNPQPAANCTLRM